MLGRAEHLADVAVGETCVTPPRDCDRPSLVQLHIEPPQEIDAIRITCSEPLTDRPDLTHDARYDVGVVPVGATASPRQARLVAESLRELLGSLILRQRV
jgi:hypothetical protein